MHIQVRLRKMVLALSCLSFHLGLLLFFSDLLVPTISNGDSSHPRKQVALFVFGDSVYDPGNNNYLNISIDLKANFPPYGETFFKHPTGRFSDGRLIPDFIAEYANLPLLEPYLNPDSSKKLTNGTNFASAGSCVLVETNPETINLELQLSYFEEVANLLKQTLGDAEANKMLINAVYLSSTGGVDYLMFHSYYPNATESQMQVYVNMVMGNMTVVLKEIYELGGRKFAFQNIGPLGCMPETKQMSNVSGNQCVEEVSALARLHNNALTNATRELESQLPGFKYSIFDYYNALDVRIKNPSKYGFKVGDIACCGSGIYRGSDCGLEEPYDLCSDPNQFLFFDGGHPTEHCNSQLAELFWNGTPKITSPLNMKQLFELEPIIEKSTKDYGTLIDE